MSEQIKMIAQRFKALREISDFSIAEISNKLSITPELYTQYESGNVEIPVSLLYEIANIYHVELAEILTGDSPKLHIYSLVRRDKGYAVDRRKEYKYQNLAYNFVNKHMEPFMVTVPVTGDDEEIHLNTHPGQEMNYVIEGSLKVIIDKKELIVNEGDTLYFDSTYPHGMKALNHKPAKFFAIILN